MQPLLATAVRAADAAADVHARWAGRIGPAQASQKGRGDFVSGADLEAEAAALSVIRARYPGDAVLAEEGTGERPTSSTGRLWVVDPLDGTANFLHRHPMYAASVAVSVEDRPVAGAVSCATTGERWWAARGEGAWKSGRRIRVSGATSLEGGLVGTGFPFKVLDLLPEYLEQLGQVLRAGAGVRRGGSAALDLCYLAEGRFDAFWELFLNPWDFAAGIVIVEEAGGLVTDLGDRPLALEPGGVLGAATPSLLAELSGLLTGGGARTGAAASTPGGATGAAPGSSGQP